MTLRKHFPIDIKRRGENVINTQTRKHFILYMNKKDSHHRISRNEPFTCKREVLLDADDLRNIRNQVNELIGTEEDDKIVTCE